MTPANGGNGAWTWAMTLAMAALTAAQGALAMDVEYPENIQTVLQTAKPLEHGRGERLPLYLWPARNPGVLGDAKALELVRELDARGIALYCTWKPGDIEGSAAQALPVAKAQQALGLRVNADATPLMHRFCDGSEATAHLDAEGQPFFDTSCGKAELGCPFRLDPRIPEIRGRIEAMAKAYAKAGTPLDFVFADWEIDGPIEWNANHESAKRCRVCRENVPDIDDFLAYQYAVRTVRSRLQREAYALPLRQRFPGILVGNYAVYPNDGWRYWYDWFETYRDGQPARSEQDARYRHWANEFEPSGYTFAMPVVYPWSPMYAWYDFEPGDFRWFYNGLLTASNAGRHKAPGTPIVAFVHWHTVDLSAEGEAPPPQFSERVYQELLWHMLLRGTDTFFLWCRSEENEKEIELLHPVYAAAQEFGRFLEGGRPICFSVTAKPGPVVSGLRLGERVLVRRTDFTGEAEPVRMAIPGGGSVTVPRAEGVCQVLPIEP